MQNDGWAAVRGDESVGLKMAERRRHGFACDADQTCQFLMGQSQSQFAAISVPVTVSLHQLVQKANHPVAAWKEQNVSQAVFDAPAAPADEFGDVERDIQLGLHEPKHVLTRDDHHFGIHYGFRVALPGFAIENSQFAEHLSFFDECKDRLLAVRRYGLDFDTARSQNHHALAGVARGVAQRVSLEGAEEGVALQTLGLVRREILEQIASFQEPEPSFHANSWATAFEKERLACILA